ncbi:universal stress protein [Micromonospora profundi]|uniref:Universal stress protein n=1 Tax=Micromonospora profundi TaxID=1420889 RepID=A0AAJ6HSJ4_9ACTN|nr:MULTISPECIES: universal stress protein [Micromonospora]KOX10381.1 universal stress protein UspA [Micromonospora sp. NRRL B-16802]NJC13865.1 nucleotide-binding universal stress UspA family protein [Micromonospora profundi]WLS45467.1 universal stress protein [Micromonospora profundi]
MAAPADAEVLVGLGSEHDLAVVEQATREAAGHGRALHLLHVFNWQAAFSADTVAAPRQQAEELITQAAQLAHRIEPDLTVNAEIVEGAMLPTLIRRSETAFLLAVGDSGMAGSGQGVPAETSAVQLAARAGCPLLVVRREPPPQGPVLVGVDGSPSSHLALRWALACAARRDTPLLAMRVAETDEDTDAVAEQLGEAMDRHAHHHPEVSTECRVVRGDPGKVLVDTSRSAQVVLVAARGDEPGRAILGAVAQSLLYHSPAPVVVVRGLAEVPLAGPGTRPNRDRRP